MRTLMNLVPKAGDDALSKRMEAAVRRVSDLKQNRSTGNK
jgi:hypothetical protein